MQLCLKDSPGYGRRLAALEKGRSFAPWHAFLKSSQGFVETFCDRYEVCTSWAATGGAGRRSGSSGMMIQAIG